MMLNHLSCIKSDHATADKNDRYMFNKIKGVEDAVKKFLKPVERHLFDIGAQEEVLDMIVAVHDMIDPIITPKNEQV
jgi:hypothetical protein